jgi:hypothetical protein
MRLRACRSGKFVETGIHERKIQGNLIPIKTSFTGNSHRLTTNLQAEKPKLYR